MRKFNLSTLPRFNYDTDTLHDLPNLSLLTDNVCVYVKQDQAAGTPKSRRLWDIYSMNGELAARSCSQTQVAKELLRKLTDAETAEFMAAGIITAREVT